VRPAIRTSIEPRRDLGLTSITIPQRTWLQVGGLCLLALVLSIISLGRESFRLDEAYSVFVARLSAADFWRVVTDSEANGALYYVMLRGWISLGGGEVTVRLLSVIPGVASIPLSYAIGRRLFGRATGLGAAALLTVNAFLIQFAQEARGYSLALFLVLLSSYLFVRAVTEGGRRIWWAYALVTGLAPYAHFFAAFVVVAHIASLSFLDRRPLRRTLMLVYAAIALLIAPLAAFVLTTSGSQIGWIPPLSLGTVTSAVAQLAGARTVAGAVLLVALFAICWLSALRILSDGAWPVRRSRHAWGLSLSIGWVVFPVTGALGISLINPLFVDRYLIVALPGLVLTAAIGLDRLKPSLAKIGLLTLVLLSLSQVAVLHVVRDKDDWRSATRYVMDHSLPEDGIVFYRPTGRVPFGYYLDRIAGGAVAGDAPIPIPAVSDWDSNRLKPGPRDFDYGAIGRLAEPVERLWVVLNPLLPEHRQGLQAALEPTFTRVTGRAFTDILVVLYVRS
jgi:mannosyltransferase